MTDNNADSPKKHSPVIRSMVILLCCAGAIGGLACATMAVSDRGNSRSNSHYNTPVLTDSIFALATPDATSAAKIGHTNAIAFLGKQHTYLLVEGGQQLFSIARELEGDKVVLEGTDRQLFLKGKTVWGHVTLRYVPGPDVAQAESDKGKLSVLGFSVDGQGVYRVSVPVKGVVCPVAKQSKDLPGGLKQTRDIAFYNSPDSKPPPDLGLLVEVPFAIAVDIVLAPVYVLGFLLIVISL